MDTLVPVYELAKELGIINKELVIKIRSLGISVLNHMSRLSASDVAKVRRALGSTEIQIDSLNPGKNIIKVITDVDELVKLIDDPKTEYQETRITVNLPWQIRPHEYLQFAELDIKGNDKRSIVNSLGNAKRALECQLDSLMIAFGMSGVSAAWNVPKKLEFLKKINVVAPSILGKINKHRNEMEHRYICPTHETVEDFVGVVALFLPATEKHIHDFAEDFDFSCARHQGFRVTFNGGKLLVRFSSSPRDQPEVSFGAGSEEYLKLLAALMRARNPNK